MDKGIRPAARAKFAELNEQRRRGIAPYVGARANTKFRKDVRYWLIENFGITEASASTHYNEAFQFLKELNAELVSGLGRPPEKNNGGRRRKVQVQVAEAVELLQQTEFTVKKKGDGSVVAEGLSLEDARALVERAAAQKKAKLYWV